MIINDVVERANGNLILDWLDTFERKSQTNKQTNKQGFVCFNSVCIKLKSAA